VHLILKVTQMGGKIQNINCFSSSLHATEREDALGRISRVD
jgi:hypothetical protein